MIVNDIPSTDVKLSESGSLRLKPGMTANTVLANTAESNLP